MLYISTCLELIVIIYVSTRNRLLDCKVTDALKNVFSSDD